MSPWALHSAERGRWPHRWPRVGSRDGARLRMKQDLRCPQVLGMALQALLSGLVWPDAALQVQVSPTMAPQTLLSELGSPDSISHALFLGLSSLCSPLRALQACCLGHGLLDMAL